MSGSLGLGSYFTHCNTTGCRVLSCLPVFEFHMATYGFIWEVLCVHNETTEYVINDMSNHHPTMSLVELSNMCLTFVQSFRRTLKVIAQRNEACTHALQLAYLLLHVVALVLKHGI